MVLSSQDKFAKFLLDFKLKREAPILIILSVNLFINRYKFFNLKKNNEMYEK